MLDNHKQCKDLYILRNRGGISFTWLIFNTQEQNIWEQYKFSMIF